MAAKLARMDQWRYSFAIAKVVAWIFRCHHTDADIIAGRLTWFRPIISGTFYECS